MDYYIGFFMDIISTFFKTSFTLVFIVIYIEFSVIRSHSFSSFSIGRISIHFTLFLAALGCFVTWEMCNVIFEMLMTQPLDFPTQLSELDALIKQCESNIPYDRYLAFYSLYQMDAKASQLIFDDVDSNPTAWSRISSICLNTIDELTLALCEKKKLDSSTASITSRSIAPGRPKALETIRKRTKPSQFNQIWNLFTGENNTPSTPLESNSLELPALLQSSHSPTQEVKMGDFNVHKTEQVSKTWDHIITDISIYIWAIRCNVLIIDD